MVHGGYRAHEQHLKFHRQAADVCREAVHRVGRGLLVQHRADGVHGGWFAGHWGGVRGEHNFFRRGQVFGHTHEREVLGCCAFADRAFDEFVLGIRHQAGVDDVVDEDPRTRSGERTLVGGGVEGVQQGGAEFDECPGEVGDTVLQGPVVPVVHIDLEVDVYQAVSKSARHVVNHSAVASTISRSDHGPTHGEFIFANLSVEDELVGSSLHGARCAVHFVQEQDALAFGGQEVRRDEGHLLLGAGAFDHRETLEVDGVQEIKADVAQLEAEVLGDFSDDVGLAYAGRPPEKCGALAFDEVREGRGYLRWAHDGFLSVIPGNRTKMNDLRTVVCGGTTLCIGGGRGQRSRHKSRRQR